MIQYLFLALFFVGIYGLLSSKNLIKMLISLNILELGLNLFIISIGYVKGGSAPIITLESVSNYVDPLPQALVLTAIVIGFGTTALGLAFIRKVYVEKGSIEIDEIRGGSDD